MKANFRTLHLNEARGFGANKPAEQTNLADRRDVVPNRRRSELSVNRIRAVVPAILLCAAALQFSGQSALAQTVVPPGCGKFSGQVLAGNWVIDDHSASPVALGALGAPFIVQPVFNQITIGTAFNDFIQGSFVTGSPLDEIICGFDGHDAIESKSGNDMISGGEGSDSLAGGEGRDLISGGAGVDVIWGDDSTAAGGALDLGDVLDGDGDGDTISGQAGNDVINGGVGDDTLSGDLDADELNGGPDDDSLDGGGGEDTLSGGDDDDTLSGGIGDDLLHGGTGHDVLEGNRGDDDLFGDQGDDDLFGGTGDDAMNGGSDIDSADGQGGADVCVNVEAGPC